MIFRLLLAPLLLLALAGCGPRSDVGTIVHQERSLYRDVFVAEKGGERCMYFRLRGEPGKQSCIDLDAPERMSAEYTRLMMAGLYVQPEPRDIFVIGLGGGIVPSVLQQLVPEARIDAVEIDAAVTRVARSHFGFRPGPRTQVHEADGRVFVKRRLAEGRRYDLILLDAYDSEYIPEHLLTVEFLREVAGLLSPDGVVVANTWSTSGLYDHESATYETVFGPFLNFKSRNRVIVAGPGADVSPEQLAAAGAAWDARTRPYGVESAALLARLRTGRDWDPGAVLLTDQYSPSNLLNSGGGG